MKLFIYLIITLNFFGVRSQNLELNGLMNYIFDEVLVKKELYFVMEESIDYSIGDFELQNYQKRELKRSDINFPIDLITKPKEELKLLFWKNVYLSKAKFITKRESDNHDFFNKNNVFYAFSSPVFSKNKEYCIITISTNYKRSSEDENFVFKKTNGKWKEVFQFVVEVTTISTMH